VVSLEDDVVVTKIPSAEPSGADDVKDGHLLSVVEGLLLSR
jgi:hypothetical protein